MVLYAKIGPGTHPCHWCATPVTWTPGTRSPQSLFADHLDWDVHNNRPDNLVPSCHVCNVHRTYNGENPLIDPGELFITNSNGTRTRATKRPCESCGEIFVVRLAQIKIGKGRFCSRSCARGQPRRSSS